MSTDKSITPNLISDNLERRKLARAEMEQFASIGKFRYLLRSPYVRHEILPSGFLGHAAIDIMTILSESEDEPRSEWRDTKRRLKKRRPELWENIPQLKIPSWRDTKRYPVDMLDASDLVAVIYAVNSRLAFQIQDEIGSLFRRYDNADVGTILLELTKEAGWAGTAIHLQLKDTYAPDEFDDPKGVAGDYWK